MASQTENFCLRWNDFEKNISLAFREIREEKEFFDVTLACGNRQVQAHKVILSACSSFFKSILKQNPHQHPLIYLKGIGYNEMVHVLSYMYHGEVNVAQDDLNSFLAVAEELEVKGLTNGEQSDVAKGTLDSQAPIDTTNKRTLTQKIEKERPFDSKKKTEEVQIKSEESFINDVSENELMIQIEYLDETSSQYMENNQDYEEQNYQYPGSVYGHESRIRVKGNQEHHKK